MKKITNRMLLKSPNWAIAGQLTSGLMFCVVLWFLCLKWCGIFEPAAALGWLFSEVMLFISLLALVGFTLPIAKDQQSNLERLNGTFGQKPAKDGKIERSCPNCFSKNYFKITNCYKCNECGANWILRK